MVVPGFTNDANVFGFSIKQRSELIVRVDVAFGSPSGAKGGQSGCGEIQFGLGTLKELRVLLVRPRPSPLDEGDSEIIQQSSVRLIPSCWDPSRSVVS